MKRIYLFILGAVLSVSLCYAQKIKISGMVTDGSTDASVEFANVVLQTLDSTFVTGVDRKSVV